MIDLLIPTFLLGGNLILTLYIQHQAEGRAQPLSSWEWHMNKDKNFEKLFNDIDKIIHSSDGRRTNTILNLKDDIRGLKKAVENLEQSIKELSKNNQDEEAD